MYITETQLKWLAYTLILNYCKKFRGKKDLVSTAKPKCHCRSLEFPALVCSSCRQLSLSSVSSHPCCTHRHILSFDLFRQASQLVLLGDTRVTRTSIDWTWTKINQGNSLLPYFDFSYYTWIDYRIRLALSWNPIFHI